VEISPPQWGHVDSGIACPPFASSGDDHTSAGHAEASDKHKGVCDGIPIIEPAAVVTEHAVIFRDLFDLHCQCRHFQPYLTGLIVLPNKNLAKMARCILDSPDKTHDSRVLAEAP
jgi:hypothetical protein